jgi:hypothetical protein
MTKPDEALLWARERAAKWQDEGGGLAGPSYRKGNLDGLLGEEVEGYRAGAAASEARIKALEARVAELERQVNTLRRVVGADKIVPLRAYYEPTDEDRYGWGGQG